MIENLKQQGLQKGVFISLKCKGKKPKNEWLIYYHHQESGFLSSVILNNWHILMAQQGCSNSSQQVGKKGKKKDILPIEQ